MCIHSHGLYWTGYPSEVTLATVVYTMSAVKVLHAKNPSTLGHSPRPERVEWTCMSLLINLPALAMWDQMVCHCGQSGLGKHRPCCLPLPFWHFLGGGGRVEFAVWCFPLGDASYMWTCPQQPQRQCPPEEGTRFWMRVFTSQDP
jgi:hypothetical protein